MKKNYFIIPLITIAVVVLGSRITSAGMWWYDTLNLPSIAPEGAFIGSVWTVIFILTTISALLAWNKTTWLSWRKKFIAIFFLLNAVLNVLWSYFFFGQQMIPLALIEMIFLNITTLILIIIIWKVSKTASVLLWPYFIWVSFATYLTYKILILN